MFSLFDSHAVVVKELRFQGCHKSKGECSSRHAGDEKLNATRDLNFHARERYTKKDAHAAGDVTNNVAKNINY